jgi:hypothetical protein
MGNLMSSGQLQAGAVRDVKTREARWPSLAARQGTSTWAVG